MVQCNHENLSSDSQHTHKKPDMTSCLCGPSSRGGTHRSASLVKSASSVSMRDPAAKKRGGQSLRRTPDATHKNPHTHAHVGMHTCVYNRNTLIF